jgi:hypothetical protein
VCEHLTYLRLEIAATDKLPSDEIATCPDTNTIALAPSTRHAYEKPNVLVAARVVENQGLLVQISDSPAPRR